MKIVISTNVKGEKYFWNDRDFIIFPKKTYDGGASRNPYFTILYIFDPAHLILFIVHPHF